MFLIILLLFCAANAATNAIKLKITPNDDCITNLQQIQTTPLYAKNCCLTKLCSNRHNVLQHHAEIGEILLKLCSDKIYLMVEQSNKCNENNNNNNLNSDNVEAVNKNTNLITMPSNKTSEKSTIANCSGKFETINGKNLCTVSSSDEVLKQQQQDDRKIAEKYDDNDKKNYSKSMDANEKRMKFENITMISARISSLPFLDVPKGDEMHIYDLRLEDEYLLFEAFATLIGYLQPGEFPTGAMVDAVKTRLSFNIFILQILKMEIGVIVWIILWAMLTLAFPFLIVSYLCCSRSNLERLTEETSNLSVDFREKCTKRTLAFLMHFLLILLLIPIIFLLMGNEQISKQMDRSVSTTNIIFHDLKAFLQNTHMQISFVATSSTDITIEAIRKDLDDTEELLGRPYQKQLESETGIDIALNTLDELKLAVAEVTSLAINLLDECKSALEARNLLQEQLKDISRQLTIARQQCRLRDRTLCYTVQYTGLDVVFSCQNLTNDPQIRQLETIGKESNFNNSIESSHKSFGKVPERVSLESLPYVSEIKSLLHRKRTDVYKAAHSLDELAVRVAARLDKAENVTTPIVETVAGWDVWRWITIVCISAVLSLAWGLLLCGAPCGCDVTSKTSNFLLSGVTIGCLLCLVMWMLGTLSFLMGIHGQSALCQPLYDPTQQYKALQEVVDALQVFKEFGGGGGKHNDTFTVGEMLRNCLRNKPAYTTFHLHNQFDIKSLTNYKSWSDFQSVINNFTIARENNNLEILSPSLQLNLQLLSTISSANLTKYRVKMSGAVTRRDLNSFAEQMNNVARQLTDLSSSQRFDNLASATRRIIHNQMAKLSEIQDRILYKVTALDVLLQPLSKQANLSLAHLKTIQYFFDNQAWQISETTTREFTSRIEEYLENLHNYIIYKVTKEIGKCRPLWDIFHSTRFCICKLIVDPMNGISFASFWIILMFVGIAPVAIKLIEHYRELNEELLTSITHRRARDGLIINDESTWATPSSSSPGQASMSRNIQSERSLWTSPALRQPSEPFIPPPPSLPTGITSPISQHHHRPPAPRSKFKSPKRLSTIASRISAARVPQIPSVSRARSPRVRGRHESLRLIEPICWKSGTQTSRSWI